MAAEQTLWGVLPALLDGTAPRQLNDLRQGGYFGGRKPEDGRMLVISALRAAGEPISAQQLQASLTARISTH